jgi:hypothetical protein
MALFESREETQIHLNVQEGKLDFFKKKKHRTGGWAELYRDNAVRGKRGLRGRLMDESTTGLTGTAPSRSLGEHISEDPGSWGHRRLPRLPPALNPTGTRSSRPSPPVSPPNPRLAPLHAGECPPPCTVSSPRCAAPLPSSRVLIRSPASSPVAAARVPAPGSPARLGRKSRSSFLFVFFLWVARRGIQAQNLLSRVADPCSSGAQSDFKSRLQSEDKLDALVQRNRILLINNFLS